MTAHRQHVNAPRRASFYATAENLVTCIRSWILWDSCERERRKSSQSTNRSDQLHNSHTGSRFPKSRTRSSILWDRKSNARTSRRAAHTGNAQEQPHGTRTAETQTRSQKNTNPNRWQHVGVRAQERFPRSANNRATKSIARDFVTTEHFTNTTHLAVW